MARRRIDTTISEELYAEMKALRLKSGQAIALGVKSVQQKQEGEAEFKQRITKELRPVLDLLFQLQSDLESLKTLRNSRQEERISELETKWFLLRESLDKDEKLQAKLDKSFSELIETIRKEVPELVRSEILSYNNAQKPVVKP